MSIIVAAVGILIWGFAATDSIWNGADLLGATMTMAGAIAFARKQNKENENDQ